MSHLHIINDGQANISLATFLEKNRANYPNIVIANTREEFQAMLKDFKYKFLMKLLQDALPSTNKFDKEKRRKQVEDLQPVIANLELDINEGEMEALFDFSVIEFGKSYAEPQMKQIIAFIFILVFFIYNTGAISHSLKKYILIPY